MLRVKEAVQSRVSSQAGLSAALTCVDMTRPRSGLDLVKSRVVPTLFLVPQRRKRDMSGATNVSKGPGDQGSYPSRIPVEPLAAEHWVSFASADKVSSKLQKRSSTALRKTHMVLWQKDSAATTVG